MVEKIIWRKRALYRLEKLLPYLTEEFGEKVAETFLERLNTELELISEFPELGPKHPTKNQHLRVMHRLTSIIYKITSNQLIVLDIWDNRRKPK